MSLIDQVKLPKRLNDITETFETTVNVKRNYTSIQSVNATYTSGSGAFIIINLPPGINNTKCSYLTMNIDVANGSNSYNRMSNPYPGTLFTRAQVYAGSVLLEDVLNFGELYAANYACKPYNAVNNNAHYENTDATRQSISEGNNMFKLELDLLKSLQVLWPTSMMNNQLQLRLYIADGASALEGDVAAPVATLTNIFWWYQSLIIQDPQYEALLKQALEVGIQLPILSWESNQIASNVSSTTYNAIVPFKRQVCQALMFIIREEGLTFSDDDKFITTITNPSEFSVKINGEIYPYPKFIDMSTTPAYGWVFRNLFQDFMKSAYYDSSVGDENVLQFIQATYRPLLIDTRKSYGKFPQQTGVGNGLDVSGAGSSIVLQTRFASAPTSAEIIAYICYENIITLSSRQVTTTS